jgi:hypothetical protein
MQAVKPLANRQAAARGVGTPKFGVWEAALGEAARLGNEFGAALDACSLSTVSDSIGKEQHC